MLASGPPRARIARSSSGRGAHPAASTSAARIAAPLPFEVAAGRRSPRFCASLAPPPPPEPAAPPAPKNTVGAWLLASPTPKTVGQGYFGLIAANADAVSTVIDYLGTVPDVDPARIAIGGTSTGGFIALEATAADARIRAALIIAACGDYHRFLHLSSLGMKGEPLDLDPAYHKRLREWEPPRHAARPTPPALLLVSGPEDLALPISRARATTPLVASSYR